MGSSATGMTNKVVVQSSLHGIFVHLIIFSLPFTIKETNHIIALNFLHYTIVDRRFLLKPEMF